MGKGDRKSKKGKIWSGTFGKRRPRANNKDVAPVKAKAKKAKPKKS